MALIALGSNLCLDKFRHVTLGKFSKFLYTSASQLQELMEVTGLQGRGLRGFPGFCGLLGGLASRANYPPQDSAP